MHVARHLPSIPKSPPVRCSVFTCPGGGPARRSPADRRRRHASRRTPRHRPSIRAAVKPPPTPDARWDGGLRDGDARRSGGQPGTKSAINYHFQYFFLLLVLWAPPPGRSPSATSAGRSSRWGVEVDWWCWCARRAARPETILFFFSSPRLPFLCDCVPASASPSPKSPSSTLCLPSTRRSSGQSPSFDQGLLRPVELLLIDSSEPQTPGAARRGRAEALVAAGELM